MPHLGSWRPQTLPINQLMDLAFGVFNDRDGVEEAKKIQGQQLTAQLLEAALPLHHLRVTLPCKDPW